MEVPKNLEPDLPFTIQTRQNDGTRPKKKYNPYGDDFVVDRIDLKKTVEEVVGLEVKTVSQDIDIEVDHDQEWIEDRSKPEVEFDDEQQESYEQEFKKSPINPNKLHRGSKQAICDLSISELFKEYFATVFRKPASDYTVPTVSSDSDIKLSEVDVSRRRGWRKFQKKTLHPKQLS